MSTARGEATAWGAGALATVASAGCSPPIPRAACCTPCATPCWSPCGSPCGIDIEGRGCTRNPLSPYARLGTACSRLECGWRGRRGECGRRDERAEATRRGEAAALGASLHPSGGECGCGQRGVGTISEGSLGGCAADAAAAMAAAPFAALPLPPPASLMGARAFGSTMRHSPLRLERAMGTPSVLWVVCASSGMLAARGDAASSPRTGSRVDDDMRGYFLGLLGRIARDWLIVMLT